MQAPARWKLRSADLAWRTWGDESVVFNPLSGDTHMLDLVAREGLLCFADAILDRETLGERLAQRLGVENDPELQHYAERLLNRFANLGLLERETETL